MKNNNLLGNLLETFNKLPPVNQAIAIAGIVALLAILLLCSSGTGGYILIGALAENLRPKGRGKSNKRDTDDTDDSETGEQD